jgi:hypothetical protein
MKPCVRRRVSLFSRISAMKTSLSRLLTLLALAPAQAQIFRPGAASGAVLGAMAGAIMGNNSGSLNPNT